MENLIIFIKLNCSAPAVQPAIGYVEDSYRHNCEHFYYTGNTDTQTTEDLLDSLGTDGLTGYQIVFIVYRKVPEIFIKKVYVGQVTNLEQMGNSYQIHYQVMNEIVSPLVIDNFMKFSNLNIDQDFDEDSHISIEDSVSLRRQLAYATDCPQNIGLRAVNYSRIDSENGLSEFAQRNEYCQRFYNFLPPSETRSEYQRDYDRIVYSKAFRRMVDKAQIFTSSKGDHYRTRMTHTLCVTQIARSIASRLNMNVPLTEAIALGHDLGHTPFGHQGERTLDQMSRKNGGGGFKHNYQSLNVASVLEEEYIECSGLDLSLQVLEGMWKHTRIRKHSGDPLLCSLSDFLPQDITEELVGLLYPENDFCSTVEGQIVCVADEIAQRSHDLDDALSAGLLSVDGLLETLSLKKLHSLKHEIETLKVAVQNAREHQRIFISSEELLISRISSQIVNYFISDVVTNFNVFLERDANIEAIRDYFAQNNRVNCSMIEFSAEGRVLNDYLETIVTKQVINSSEVAAFDDKAKRVVSMLFDLYYDNPRLLHEGTLQRIYIRMRKKTANTIHFQEGDISLVNDEWERIKHPEKAARLRDLRETFPDIDLNQYADISAFMRSLGEGSDNYNQVQAYLEACKNEYIEKKQILIRSICDFISGMTDTYAMNEYRKLLGG